MKTRSLIFAAVAILALVLSACAPAGGSQQPRTVSVSGTGTAYLEQMLAGLEPLKATFVVTPNTIVIAASGDLAVEEGTWVTTIPAASGASFTDNGKYLVAWKKVNGTWLAQFDTWNSSNASASAEVTTAPANP